MRDDKIPCPRGHGKKRMHKMLREWDSPKRWWNEVVMPMVAAEYEKQTGRKWVPESAEVKEWIEKTFPKTTNKDTQHENPQPPTSDQQETRS